MPNNIGGWLPTQIVDTGGAAGAKGDTGATGAPGPNQITSTTSCTVSGLLKGFPFVAQAVSGVDYGDMLAVTYDLIINGKTTLTAVKADTDIADALTKKHANSLDHSNSLDHNGGTQDSAIDGKEPANANIQTHVTSAHAPSNAQKNSDITKAEIETKLIGEISSHTHAGGSGESEVIVLKVGDTSNATTTYADATGLSFTSVGSKTYIIEAWIRWETSVKTVGIKLSVNGPATPGFVADVWNAALTTSLISGGGGNAYKVGGASASAFALTDNLAMLNILYRAPAGGGVVTIQFAAETTGTITIKDGSVLRYRQVN